MLRNTEHRMKHWLQLVAIPNSASSSSNQEMQAKKKKNYLLTSRKPAHVRLAGNRLRLLVVPLCSRFLLLPHLLKVRKVEKEAKRAKKKEEENRALLPRSSRLASKTSNTFGKTSPTGSRRARYVTTFKRMPAGERVTSSLRTSALVVAGLSPTMTAGALLLKSTELHLLKRLRRSRKTLHPCQFPQFLPL